MWNHDSCTPSALFDAALTSLPPLMPDTGTGESSSRGDVLRATAAPDVLSSSLGESIGYSPPNKPYRTEQAPLQASCTTCTMVSLSARPPSRITGTAVRPLDRSFCGAFDTQSSRCEGHETHSLEFVEHLRLAEHTSR